MTGMPKGSSGVVVESMDCSTRDLPYRITTLVSLLILLGISELEIHVGYPSSPMCYMTVIIIKQLKSSVNQPSFLVLSHVLVQTKGN